jgi:predicted DNA-binding transcriptional regulator AlpA
MAQRTRVHAATMLTEREAAEILNLSVRTLQTWRSACQGPVFVKIGGKRSGAVRYRKADIDAFITAGVRLPKQKGGK